MDVRLDARPNALRIARKLAGPAALALGAPDRTAFELEVALGEALSNAYIHAYGSRPGGQIQMHFEVRATRLSVTITDNGKSLRRRPRVPSAIPLSSAHGRGLYLMSHLMDEVNVIHPVKDGRGTAIRMEKELVADHPLNAEQTHG